MNLDHAFFSLIQMLALQQAQIDVLREAIQKGIRDQDVISAMVHSRYAPSELKERRTHQASVFQNTMRWIELRHPNANFPTLVDGFEDLTDLDLGPGNRPS